MTIKAVVFDMDGLLLDTEGLYKLAWQQAASDLGFELDDDAYATLVGRPNDACEGELRRRFGSEFPMPSFRTRWADLWREAVATRGIPSKPGLEPLLAFVEARGMARAIATSSDARYTELSLRKAGLAGRFEVIVTGDQIARGKPAPDIYLEAARRMGHAPAECLAFEDSDAGVLAATSAGMTTICVPDIKAPSDATVRAAYRVIPSLEAALDVMASLVERP